jgi:hypothetical protein
MAGKIISASMLAWFVLLHAVSAGVRTGTGVGTGTGTGTGAEHRKGTRRVAVDSGATTTAEAEAGAGGGGDYPCDIRRVYLAAGDLWSRGMLETRGLTEPVIFVTDANRQRELAELVSIENLLENYGSSPVELRSSNSYSKDIHKVMLSEYIRDLPTAAAQTDGLSNETFYLFGGSTGELWDKVEESYVLPGCKHCAAAGAVIPGLGGYHSGVAFHFHGPGFSEVIHGAKRWFLYPPKPVEQGAQSSSGLAPGFHPDMSVAQWTADVYSYFEEDSAAKPLECVIRPGEILFFPDRWVHGIMNVEDYVFFVSVFLDPQLMPN